RYTFGWSGDSGNGEDVAAGWKNLANQIPLGLSAGMGLIPFWTTDISGYCGDITDYDEFSELYIRWLQFGIFNPLSRAHHEGNNAVEPWLFGEQAEQIAKQCIELKYQLHPYIYTMAREAYDTGMPIMRALVLEYPDDENVYGIDNQFMFGKDLLIAPVIKKGATKRAIYLPEGNWIDYNNTEKTYVGEQTIEYAVSLNTIPMFVKSGAIIPKIPVMQYIGQMEHAPIIFEIFQSGNLTSFDLYEDDGVTNNYKNEVFSKIHIESKNTDASLEIVLLEAQNDSFKTKDRNYLLQIHLPSKPKKILLNNEKLESTKLKKINEHMNSNFKYSAFNYNTENQILLIRMPDTKQNINVSITK
ncbi:MAG: glycoside hydrolase family 31 protein, partial [Ignavibacteriae bacterium]|nr:glycoside hydrolase family 31 protein [Ignavibacteriota bacterium]